MLELKNVSKTYRQKKGLRTKKIEVLKEVNLKLAKGEVLGLVGESGSGKSTLAKIIVGLEAPDQGEVRLEGNLLGFPRKFCPTKIQMVFQDPLSSLNPRQKIAAILDEPLKLNTNYSRPKRLALIKTWLKRVGLSPDCLNRFPHQFSGGQRQRIALARSFVLEPELLILDEPVSALDVSIQAQILLLLQELQKKYQATYIFISHDLAVVKYLAHKVAVLWQGQIVEQGPAQEVFINPRHQYTRKLILSVPKFKKNYN